MCNAGRTIPATCRSGCDALGNFALHKLDTNKLPHLIPLALLQLSEGLDGKVIEKQILKVRKRRIRQGDSWYLAVALPPVD
jgi:hypothetical protein